LRVRQIAQKRKDKKNMNNDQYEKWRKMKNEQEAIEEAKECNAHKERADGKIKNSPH